MVFGNSAFFARNGLLVNNGLIYANNGMVGINTPNGPSYTLHINATDGVLVPVGNTAQRPANTSGLFRYNTDTASFEGFANGAWGSVGGGSTITFATSAQFLANTANVALSPTSFWGGGTFTSLTDATTVTVDLATGINFKLVTIGGNRTLGWPTNIKAGQVGQIIIQQDGTGGRTLSFFSNATVSYVFDTGSAPTINATANKFSVLTYAVLHDSAHILITMPGYGAY